MEAALASSEELTSHEVGRLGEHVCRCWLESHDFEILEQNWRCKFGEADIIAREDDEVVFVEVKTRYTRGEDDLMPERAVDDEKRRRYRGMVGVYLAHHPNISRVRFDVAGVTLQSTSLAHMHYIKGVWMAD